MTTSQAATVRKTRRPGDAPARDPVREFANRIISEIENGVKPRVRPWDSIRAVEDRNCDVPVISVACTRSRESLCSMFRVFNPPPSSQADCRRFEITTSP
jgi:hypothetical protein